MYQRNKVSIICRILQEFQTFKNFFFSSTLYVKRWTFEFLNPWFTSLYHKNSCNSTNFQYYIFFWVPKTVLPPVSIKNYDLLTKATLWFHIPIVDYYMMQFYKKNIRFGGLVCVGGQSVVDYYMMQFYKKKSIFWGASVCWGLNCSILLNYAI